MAQPAWDVALLFPLQGHWTEADYLALETNRLVELSGGVLEVPEMPTHRHQMIVAFLYRSLHEFVTARDLGIVAFAPLPVRLAPGLLREPDVLFMAREHRDRIREQFWEGADLVMEVVSPGRRRTDKLHKVRDYARAGIAEYWLVDPEAQVILVHVLKGELYEVRQSAAPGEAARSAALAGFEIAVDAAFAAA
jgi:Uma2 family endonuclease